MISRRLFSTTSKLPPCNFVPKKYDGPSYDKLTKIRRTNMNPALTTIYKDPLAVHQGHMQWLFDINGKRYLDLFGGICTVSVGHCHPKINAAVKDQMEVLNHVSNIFLHPKIHEYAERLTAKMPGDLKVAYFVNSGSEANDLAILMARLYTKNFEILSLRNCYHGMTCATMGLTATGKYKYNYPNVSGIHHVMNPDVYKGIWGGKNCRDSVVQTTRQCNCSGECDAKNKYIDQLKEHFEYTIPKSKGLAAFFAESIQGVGGSVQFPKGYIKEAAQLVRENGGLMISDEVQTGFGRTGDHFWGFEGHEIVPDIVTMAKGIGNGYPLAAVVTTPKIAEALNAASHFNTFGGNPIASTVGITVLDIIEEEKLQQNSKAIGTNFLKQLSQLREEYPKTIGDVRGKGLMIGVELVKNGTTEPLLDKQIYDVLKDKGVIMGQGGAYGNVMRIKPPMCITQQDVDFTMSTLREAFTQLKYK